MVAIKKSLVITLILILLSVFGGVYLVYPAYKKGGGLKKDISELNKKLDRQKGLGTRINFLFDDYSAQDPKQIDFIQNKVVPPSFDLPQLLIQMEALTSENGLIMKTISFVTAAPSGTTAAGLKSGSINLALEGSYSAFKNFLRNVETNIRLMDTKSVSFSSPRLSENQPIPIFGFSVSLKTYYK